MKTISRFLLAVVLTGLMPLHALAAASLSAADSIAGIGASITLNGFEPNQNLIVQVTDPSGAAVTLRALTDGNGNGVARLGAEQSETAGLYRVRIDGTNAQTSFDVLPESVDPDMTDVSVSPSQIQPDGSDEAIVTVTLMDRFGNTLPSRPVTLTSSRSYDYIVPLSNETNAQGQQKFSVSTEESGVLQLRAVDLLSGMTVGTEASVQAGAAQMAMGSSYTPPTQQPAYPQYPSYPSYPAPYYPYPPYPTYPPAYSPYGAQVGTFDVIDHFEIDAPDEMITGQEAAKITIRAVDRAGHTVEDYVGSITFDSTDPDAVLPNFGRYTFRDRDLGQKQFPLALKFNAPGEQTIHVEDSNDARIMGETTVNVTGGHGAGEHTISITSHSDGDTVNALTIQVEGKGPKFINVIVMGGAQDVEGSTDDEGNFSVPVTLNATSRDITLRVRDKDGSADSGPIKLILDVTAPEIKKVTFSPEEIQEGDQALVAVESDPGLQQVLMRITDPVTRAAEEITLLENPTASGSYQGFFTAPKRGQYQPVIVAMDSAGNTTETRAVLTIGAETLPTVQNVRVSPRTGAVALEWDPVEGDVDGYRIYVGDSPTNFLYNLDTGRVTTKATVAGLSSGKTYYIAVTALREDIESKEKSEIVTARTLGLALEATPQDSGLLLQWELASETPLSSYVLEYGVQDGVYTERRLLNGELKAFTVRDLLNNVTYYVRLTPVTITGDKLDELAATDSASPNGGVGFQASAADPIPFDPAHPPVGIVNPPSETPSTGIPPIAIWVALLVAPLAFWLHIRRRKQLQQSEAFLRAIEQNYRG